MGPRIPLVFDLCRPCQESMILSTEVLPAKFNTIQEWSIDLY